MAGSSFCLGLRPHTRPEALYGRQDRGPGGLGEYTDFEKGGCYGQYMAGAVLDRTDRHRNIPHGAGCSLLGHRPVEEKERVASSTRRALVFTKYLHCFRFIGSCE